jgi:hypothetical protein
MKRILVAILAISCSPALTTSSEAPIGSLEQPMLGVVGSNPNPLTFWWYAGNGAELRPALECALERIRAATCLPVDVSLDAHHWVRQKPPEDMGGRIGWTTGSSWGSVRIALKTPMGPQTNCRVLVHEIAQHLLQRRNDAGHVPPSFQISEQLITNICAVQASLGFPCGCSVPETDNDPVESTQGVCVD